jgi:hypothetical protein
MKESPLTETFGGGDTYKSLLVASLLNLILNVRKTGLKLNSANETVALIGTYPDGLLK